MTFIVGFVFWGLIVGALAYRKNRNAIGWGIAGGLSWFIALLVLAFMPYLCPECGADISNDAGKTGTCPNCGDFKPRQASSGEQQILSALALTPVSDPLNRIISTCNIPITEDKSPGSAEELVQERLTGVCSWIAAEAFNRCGTADKDSEHYGIATMVIAIMAVGYFTSRAQQLGFEVASLKACIKTTNMTDPTLDVSWAGKAIAVVRTPSFRDDLEFIREAITAFVEEPNDDNMIGISATLSELAEEVQFNENQKSKHLH